LDDIAALMDDVVVMSKIATKKKQQDIRWWLAVNAEKASGFALEKIPCCGP
jgi:predicted DNA repair protein MutK